MTRAADQFARCPFEAIATIDVVSSGVCDPDARQYRATLAFDTPDLGRFLATGFAPTIWRALDRALRVARLEIDVRREARKGRTAWTQIA